MTPIRWIFSIAWRPIKKESLVDFFTQFMSYKYGKKIKRLKYSKYFFAWHGRLQISTINLRTSFLQVERSNVGHNMQYDNLGKLHFTILNYNLCFTLHSILIRQLTWMKKHVMCDAHELCICGITWKGQIASLQSLTSNRLANTSFHVVPHTCRGHVNHTWHAFPSK